MSDPHTSMRGAGAMAGTRTGGVALVAAPAERPFAVQLRCTAGLEGGNALSGRAFRATLFFAKLFQKSASAPSPGKVHPGRHATCAARCVSGSHMNVDFANIA